MKRPGPRMAAALALGLVAVGLGVGALSRAEGRTPDELQMHRAVYDLAIDRVKTVSEVDGLDGRMVVEWRGGPACDGYTSEQRVVTRSSDGTGAVSISDVRLTSFEALDGSDFRFDRTEYTDGKLSDHESGHVTRENGKVILEEPDGEPETLPADVMFPTAFNIALLGAAKAGKSVFSGLLFDGTQSTATYVNAFIGKPGAAPADAKKVKIENRGGGMPLGDASAWHVHMSYFDGGEEASDGTPSFEMGFSMFPNGVMSALALEYDDVVLGGTLTQIEYFKPGSC